MALHSRHRRLQVRLYCTLPGTPRSQVAITFNVRSSIIHLNTKVTLSRPSKHYTKSSFRFSEVAMSTVASEYGAHQSAVPIEHRFNPYTDNGGTVLGIAGEDFAVLAGDTRIVSGYNINSRYEPKIFDVGDNIAMTANGFSADGAALIDRFKTAFKWYKFNNNKKLTIQSAARYIQHLLYGKRFFPFYVSTLIAGLDEDGKGAVYSYDPVGSYEREQCRAGGAAASLIMPFLDNQVNFKNQCEPGTDGGEKKQLRYLSLDEVLELVKDAFSSATERHIQVGDGLEIFIVTKEGIRKVYYPLKRD